LCGNARAQNSVQQSDVFYYLEKLTKEATGDHSYKGLRYLCGSAAGNGPNDENEKENGTEGIKRKTIKNETLEMMLNVIIAGGYKY
jgi:hypothetical protein